MVTKRVIPSETLKDTEKPSGSYVPRVIFSFILLVVYLAVLATLFNLTKKLAFNPHPDFLPTKGWDF